MKVRVLIATFVLMIAACTDALGPNTESGLAIWATVSPSVVSIADTSASLHITVNEWNPTWHTIVLPGGPPYVFTGDPKNSHGIEESIRFADSAGAFVGPGVDFWGQHEYPFEARTVKGTSYDMPLKDWFRVSPPHPGTFYVRGYFNGQEGKRASFRIAP